jgi:pimeloyl-ACP methyl ester carboxylesterase
MDETATTDGDRRQSTAADPAPPDDPETVSVTTREGDLAVELRGPADAPAVAFVHGAGISRAMWLPQARALAGDYRTATFDLPGHGARRDERFAMDAAVRSLAAVVRAVGDPAVAVGHSLGGYVALEFAAERPEPVRALVLSGASADYRDGLALATRVGGTLNQVGGRIGFVRRRFERRTAERIRALPIDDDVADAVVRGGFSLRAWGEAATALVGVDYPAMRRGFGGPVLLVNGDGDELNVPAAAAAADDPAEGDLRVATVPDAGHLANLANPEAYTAALRAFLERLDRRGVTAAGDVDDAVTR